LAGAVWGRRLASVAGAARKGPVCGEAQLPADEHVLPVASCSAQRVQEFEHEVAFFPRLEPVIVHQREHADTDELLRPQCFPKAIQPPVVDDPQPALVVGALQGEGVAFESQIGLLAKLVDRFVEVLSLVLAAREDLKWRAA